MSGFDDDMLVRDDWRWDGDDRINGSDDEMEGLSQFSHECAHGFF